MDETKELGVSPKKTNKKVELKSDIETSSPKKQIRESRKIITNGTGDSSESLHENIVKPECPKSPVKIFKVTKSPKADTIKSPIKEQQVTISSPQDSHSEREEFCGFDDISLGEQNKRKTFFRILDEVKAVEESEEEEEEEAGTSATSKHQEREEEMTVDDDHASDTDSNQMQIDDGESDQHTENTEDTEVDIMDTDSTEDVASNGKKVADFEKPSGSAMASGPTTRGGDVKVEFCGGCDAEVNDAEEGICCDGMCERWFHLRCSGLRQAEYNELSLDENAKWACSKCSGKPPPVITPDSKPLLAVRKDLTKVAAPSPKRKSLVKDRTPRTPKIDISNPAFLKPFDFGWKRELVYRSTSDGTDRRHGDIYYYTPKGKKLRSLREISEHCKVIGTDLTVDNFTFWKEPIGFDDPEKEIIRDAKLKTKDITASPIVPKKVVPKITKTPKAPPTPKLTATVTPMDTSIGGTPKTASIFPRVVLKGGKQSARSSPAQTPKLIIGKEKKKKPLSDDELEMGMLPPMWEPTPRPNEKLSPAVCSIHCPAAMGLIPTLQCVSCLCLYHPECVGLEEANLRPIHSYKCKNCQMEKPKPVTNGSKSLMPPPPLTPISTMSSAPKLMNDTMPMLPKLQRISDVKPHPQPHPLPLGIPRGKAPLTKSTSIVGGVTTWLPPSSTVHLRGPPPTTKVSPSLKALPPSNSSAVDCPNNQPVQTLVTMNSKRYIVVPKHNILSVSPATTSSAQVSDSVCSQVTTAANDATTVTSQSVCHNVPILPKPQVPTTNAFIVGSGTTPASSFQSPPGVLLVPYISPQTSPPKDGQQPQYIVVNGPSGIAPNNFIFGNIPPQQSLKLPTVPTSQPAEPMQESPETKPVVVVDTSSAVAVKRPADDSPAGAEQPPVKRPCTGDNSPVMRCFLQNMSYAYSALLQAFQFLKVQELLRCSRVCHMWRDLALHKSLWETVRMKNSQVKDWEGFSATLRRTGTKHLDLRKILMPDKPESLKAMWADCVKALSKVNTLVKLDLCRCTSSLIEQIAAVCPQLESVAAGAIKSNQLNLNNLGNWQNLTELKLKSQSGMDLNNVSVLGNLTKLKQLSLTTVKNVVAVMKVVEGMTQLESLELGDLITIEDPAVMTGLSNLTKLRRLRLEKGQQKCPTDTILQTISKLPSLVQLELINFDIKVGFEESLALCSNIKILLIIPTYVTQSATTNHLVIEGVSKLSKTLNHFVWGLTLELLRVTDLFIDQWEMGHKKREESPKSGEDVKSPNQSQEQKKLKESKGDSIPILKPSSKASKEGAVTQVDVLQLPKLHKVLTTLLPTTKIIILKVPFSATWRQTISGAQ